MKTLKCLIIVLVLAVISSATVSANPNGEMKASPLYKASLENSIAKLEGKAETQPLYTDANGNVLATSSGCVVPDARETQISTCSPSYCGSSQTCEGTCNQSTCGGSTCASTCASTCVSTCASTCVSTCASTCVSTCASTCASTCQISYCTCSDPYVQGTVRKWPSGNWDGTTQRTVLEYPDALNYTTFSWNGYYYMKCSSARRNLLAVGQYPTGTYAGSAVKPSQGNYLITVNITAYLQP